MGSVSDWIIQIRAGQDSAVSRLWYRCQSDLHRCAARRLRGTVGTWEDHEDVVQETFAACVRAIRASGTRAHNLLGDRTGLWKYLTVSVRNRATSLKRYWASRRIDGMNDAAALITAGWTPSPSVDLAVNHRDIDPAETAAQTGEIDRLYALLRADLTEIADLKMIGLTNTEIADELGVSLSTVERRLRLIRRIWSSPEVSDADSEETRNGS